MSPGKITKGKYFQKREVKKANKKWKSSMKTSGTKERKEREITGPIGTERFRGKEARGNTQRKAEGGERTRKKNSQVRRSHLEKAQTLIKGKLLKSLFHQNGSKGKTGRKAPKDPPSNRTKCKERNFESWGNEPDKKGVGC